METLTFKLTLIFYFTTTIVGLIEIFKESKGLSKIILTLSILGFTFHTLNIVIRYFAFGYLPVVGMHHATSFFVWCIIAVFFVIEYKYRISITGSFILPIAFILILVSSTFRRDIFPLPPILQSYWFDIHITLAFVANAAFAIAFAIGIMYLLQEHFLKKKKVSRLFQRLPNLQILDEINYRLISFGFPFLTFAIITGALWAENAWGSYWRWDPKEIWSLVTWITYALILHLRIIRGWQGKKAIIISIIGFISVLFTFFGVNLLLKSLHNFNN
ncbi:MAG: c-type cytochrome biogenesis protein CcsB [Thermodesulfovibrionales bacterium]|nr:c-type cytochrome biogenesis protein CcsB [Thermodesulfovibrionales bacterium]